MSFLSNKFKNPRARLLLAFSALAFTLNALYSSSSSEIFRALSIDYGDGTCKWQPPAYDVPEDLKAFPVEIKD